MRGGPKWAKWASIRAPSVQPGVSDSEAPRILKCEAAREARAGLGQVDNSLVGNGADVGSWSWSWFSIVASTNSSA